MRGKKEKKEEKLFRLFSSRDEKIEREEEN